MKVIRRLAFLLMVLGFTRVLAQTETCAAYVQQALAAADDACSTLGRNQACYGNVLLKATPRDGVQDFTFEQEGDLVNVADVQTLRLRQLDLKENVWGVALMKLQANLPATLPGQNVTVVLFGDVEIQNAVEPGEALPTIEIAATNGINVRSGPSTNFAVIGSLAKGETVTANGRNDASSWLRIQVPDSDSMGWVSADLVTPTGDASTLSVVEAGAAEVPFTPMQAFYFGSGGAASGCQEAPESGILIQTPQGAGKVQLRVNDVDIQLGSTAYLQAQAGATMTVSVVEGQGEVTAEGETVVVPAGAQVAIPIDADLSADGAPGEPEPYDPAALETLPVQVLPEAVVVAPPASTEDLTATQPNVQPGVGGIGLDPSMFAGMDIAAICPLFTQSLAEAGMTINDYIALMEQSMALMPADSQGDVSQFLDLLRQCG